MFHQKLTALILLTLLLSLASAEEILRCSSYNFSLFDANGKNLTLENSDIYFKYNRSNLAVYRYPRTTSVNLLLPHAEASFKVLTEDNKLVNLNNEKPFELVGVANIANSMNYDEGLKDCEFFGAEVKTGRIINDHFAQIISQCFANQLCKNFRSIGDEDFARAAVAPRNFGPLSVTSPSIKAISDNIVPANMLEPKVEEQYEDAIDAVLKKTARYFKSVSNGSVNIDDVKYTVIHAFEGVFEGVDNLYRHGRMLINESYVDEMTRLSFEFGIPKGHLSFSQLRTWGVFPFIGVLCADVDAMTFQANMTLTYTEKACQANLTGIEMSSPGYQKTYFCKPNIFLTKLWTKYYINNNAFVPSIFKDIALKIEQNMARQLIDHFDCEKFRLSRYHFRNFL